MELWIRSQDKMALAKFDLCILEKYDDKYMFIADHYKNMGTYKTKERALEVLDEIQERMINNLLINRKIYADNFDKVKNLKSDELKPYITEIYEMPQD